MEKITSTANNKIKEIIKLKSAHKRKESDLMIVEGSREIESAIIGNFKAKELYFCPKFFSDEAKIFLEKQRKKFSESGLIETEDFVFEKISHKENPEGLLATFEVRFSNPKEIDFSSNPGIIILENVEKPGNLGAIARTAYAAGIEAIIINDFQTDIYNPNVIRASMGKIFNVPIFVLSPKETKEWLESKNMPIFSATGSAKKNYDECDYKNGAAIILGTEKFGLSDFWLENCDEKIKIPMKKEIDSLNVSVSAAIIAYEMARQKNFPFSEK